MSDEIQFESEEQFIDIMKLVTAADKKSPEMLRYVKNAKIYHLIKKPEIEQAIEDAEKELSKEVRVHGKKYPVETAFMLLKKFYEEHK